MTETAIAPAADTGPARHAGPAEPDIAPVPDASGHFVVGAVDAVASAHPGGTPLAPAVPGVAYGGRFAPEALMAALDELAVAYEQARKDPAFRAELDGLLRGYAARPTLLTQAKRFGQQAGGCTVLLKREDLTHTGSHKINNVLGQALLTKRMGKKRVIAETGAGQHGVATATACALLGLDCVVYMGEEDTERQALNVARMTRFSTICFALAILLSDASPITCLFCSTHINHRLSSNVIASKAGNMSNIASLLSALSAATQSSLNEYRPSPKKPREPAPLARDTASVNCF